MRHSISTIPIGSREGEIVVQLEVDDVTIEPRTFAHLVDRCYRRFAMTTIWAHANVLASPEGRALGLALIDHKWDLTVIGRVHQNVWPLVPTQTMIDVSSLLTGARLGDQERLVELTNLTTSIPPPWELFAYVTDATWLDAGQLQLLGQILQPEFGSTLYVSPDLHVAAVQASLRVDRPWTVRPVSGPGPAAWPSG